MGTVLVGHQFRLHHLVAGSPAKLNRLGEVVSVIAPQRRHEQEDQAAGNEIAQDPPVARTGKVHDDAGQQTAGLPELAPLAPRAHGGDQQSHDHERGRHHERQEADVRVGAVRHDVHQEQQQERKDAADHDDQARQAQPVAKQ